MNIIFTLLTLFLIIAIAVGFYMEWNPTVIAILLGIAFICAVGKLYAICKTLILSIIERCKVKMFKAYRKKFVDYLSY